MKKIAKDGKFAGQIHGIVRQAERGEAGVLLAHPRELKVRHDCASSTEFVSKANFGEAWIS